MTRWLDEQEFYELMQKYRHVNQRTADGEEKTVEAFEAVKEFIRDKINDLLDDYLSDWGDWG